LQADAAPVVLARFGEIGLKGKNRPFFERALEDAMKRALSGMPGVSTRKTHGRFFVDPAPDRDLVVERLRRVFGIVSLSPAYKVPLDIEAVKRASLAAFGEAQGMPTRFKVNARRPNKSFPYTSLQINRVVGAYIIENVPGLQADMTNPEVVVYVEARESAYVYSRVIPGPGGLPVGTNGRAVALLSGGIDSPVAAWMTMKRGVVTDLLHFYSFPLTSPRSKEKVVDICRVLARYSGSVRLFVTGFTEAQKAIQAGAPAELRVILMRRLMARIAERLARRNSALALVTGDSIGQVASQTLESMNTIQRATTLPVLRPLIGMDKTEITDLARHIGTYEISIRPYEDCCSLFVPAHPKTRPSPREAEEAERRLDVQALVAGAVDATEVVEIGPGRRD